VVRLVRLAAKQNENHLLHMALAAEVRAYFAQRDLGRFAQRITVHPSADGWKTDGAHLALLGKLEALAIARRQ